jgi:hypothetical protein
MYLERLVWQRNEPNKKVLANLELPSRIWLCRGHIDNWSP